ncbi:MAG: cupin domain-containing protein [Ginsengibacter sp.]
MKKIIFSVIYLAPLLLSAQQDSIISQVYQWKQPVKSLQGNTRSTILFEGSTHDMEWLQMDALELAESRADIKMDVPAGEENLYIVKKGILITTLNDSVYTLGQGSIVLLLPGQHFSIQNKITTSCEYYVAKYRSNSPIDLQRGKDSGGSFIEDWKSIVLKPSEKGGTRNYFQRPTAMTKRLDMHVTTLNAGLKSHDPHTHRAAEMIVMIEGNTEMQIAQKFYKGIGGDVYYLGSNVLHGIRNIGSQPCTYFAIQFE